MTAQEIIDLVNTITNDYGNVTYIVADHLLAINDAQRLICQYRPDAESSTSAMLIIAGAKQSLPATARRLMSITRNMGADGTTSGNIIRKIEEEELNHTNPDWYNETGTSVAKYLYDQARPDEFYIYPSVTPPFYIEIKTADLPIDVTVVGDSISISDIYAPALVSWVVYRLLSRDGSESSNVARSLEHKQTTYDILGIKSSGDAQLVTNNEQS